MSRDEFSLPSATRADASQGRVGPASLPQSESAGLRAQALELIDDVLADSDPGGEWARRQLRRHVASHPGEPERALLAHLMETRRPARPQHPLPAVGAAEVLEPAGPARQAVSLGAAVRKRIRSVLGEKLLLTAFQPVRELPDERITGFEALTRFVSSDGADAGTWFREAEAVGLGPELEFAALRCAVTAAGKIPSDFFVAFNLSPATFMDARVQDLLEHCDLALDRIVIELKGRTDDKQWAALAQAVKPFRQRGVRVAVDGSGPGFTPADRILSLRPDIIKLDRTFIEGILGSTDPDEPAAISLAREVGAVLAAEGIETEQELVAVIGVGMTAGQGYLLGRPSVQPPEWTSWVLQTEPATADS